MGRDLGEANPNREQHDRGRRKFNHKECVVEEPFGNEREVIGISSTHSEDAKN